MKKRFVCAVCAVSIFALTACSAETGNSATASSSPASSALSSSASSALSSPASASRPEGGASATHPGEGVSSMVQTGPPSSPSGESVPPPPFSTEVAPPSVFDLDWEKLNGDWQDAMGSVKTAAGVQKYKAEVNGPMVTLVAVVGNDFDKKDASALEKEMLRQYNDLARQQDKSIEAATTDSFGGLYEEYAVAVGVAPQGKEANRDSWLAYHIVDRGDSELREV